MGGEQRKPPRGDDLEAGDREDKEDEAVEGSIADSFPASDPPAWSTPAPPEREPVSPNAKTSDNKN